MTRPWLLVLLAVCLVRAQPAQQPPAGKAQEPPEEDVSTDRPKEYTFNPLQAAKEVKIGNYYFKKGSYKAAAGRFREALKWDPNDAEAWLRLADTYLKLKDTNEANAAFTKYLELKPDGKESEVIRKKLQPKS